MNISSQENLQKCRATLAKVEANNADPRVIGLWKAKVAQAEQLCLDAAEEGKAKPKVSTTPKHPRPPKPIAGERPIGMQPCKCGCGLIASSGKNFLPGHDARFASYIRKLDKGLLRLTDLPELVQEMISQDHELVRRAREHNKPKA